MPAQDALKYKRVSEDVHRRQEMIKQSGLARTLSSQIVGFAVFQVCAINFACLREASSCHECDTKASHLPSCAACVREDRDATIRPTSASVVDGARSATVS